MQELNDQDINLVYGSGEEAWYNAGKGLADGYQWFVGKTTDFLCWASGNC